MSKGFTLIEMVVVVAIIALFAIVSIPTFLDFNEQRRLNAAIGTVQAQFYLCRSRAIAQRERQALVIFASAGETSLILNGHNYSVSGSKNQMSSWGTIPGKPAEEWDRNSIESWGKLDPGCPQAVFFFYADGTVDGPATIKITCGEYARTLMCVRATGRILVED